MNKLGEIIKIVSCVVAKKTSKQYSDADYKNVIEAIYSKVTKDYPDTSYQLIVDIVGRMVEHKYTFNEKDFDMNFRYWDKLYGIDEINNEEIKVPTKYKKLDEHFIKLYTTPQPEQRTQPWFDYRYNRITASDMATAIDCNPYESVEGFICKKCDPNFPFLDNDFVFHGKKYEQIATMLYEHIYNTKVTEFGCLPSDKYDILGASPDGISSKSTLDYKFNKKLGYMLEIKCPYVRDIKCKGKIAGEICPYYYYCQVQQQLICCDMENCDFIQCKIEEYKDRDEYMRDTEHTMVVKEDVDGKTVDVNNVMAKGYLMQFLPKEYKPAFEGDKHHYKSFYIYPPRLTMSREEYDEWVFTNLANWQKENPSIASTYYFDKVIYWKIIKAHTVTIPRDQAWFDSIFPILEDTWKKVVYYREHMEELPFLQDISDKRKNFYKERMNTSIVVNMPDKNIFDSNVVEKISKYKPKAISKVKPIQSNEDCDFVDS
jgi:putative phage-type endonuclease